MVKLYPRFCNLKVIAKTVKCCLKMHGGTGGGVGGNIGGGEKDPWEVS